MNLYLLEQNDNTGYDTYDSCVVCAENEQDAITISPDSRYTIEQKHPDTSWARSIESVTCEFLGVANENIERGIVLASFNAG